MKNKAASQRPGLTRLKFPKIYRFITDPLRRIEASKSLTSALKLQFLVFAFLALIVLSLITIFDLLSNVQKEREQTFQREKLISELKTWESIAQEFPNFKDAYYELAVISYKLGDFEKAREYIKKALFLDPNSGKARELEELLSR